MKKKKNVKKRYICTCVVQTFRSSWSNVVAILKIFTSTEKTLETTFKDAHAHIQTTAGNIWLTKQHGGRTGVFLVI